MEIAGTNPFSAARTSARAAAPPAWNAVEGPRESRITKRSQIHPANAQHFFNEGYWSADLQIKPIREMSWMPPPRRDAARPSPDAALFSRIPEREAGRTVL